jgi:aminoglycoside phosphotransferase family enzyme
MTKEQIDKLISEGHFPEAGCQPALKETHISWVMLCDQLAYKIKKPMQYSFLDFTTLEKRKYYCEREVELNSRLTDDIYLGVREVKELNGHYSIGDEGGTIADYAVEMRKLPAELQMDSLLAANKVSAQDIINLAKKIAAFHKTAAIIYQKDALDVQEKFNDLAAEKDFLEAHIAGSHAIISDAIQLSDAFVEQNISNFKSRLKAGLFRDCHGDLHSRNIFLLPAPAPFDCIEFNDDLRQIDVLNEIAFLCMDLDSFGRKDLSDLFFCHYTNLFPAIQKPADKALFEYYKCYRANIRAKINSLRARSAAAEADKKSALTEAAKYLDLMNSYVKELWVYVRRNKAFLSQV